MAKIKDLLDLLERPPRPAPVTPVVQVQTVAETEAEPVVASPTPPPVEPMRVETPVEPPTSAEPSDAAQEQQMEAELDDIPATAGGDSQPEELEDQPGPSTDTQPNLKRARSETDEAQVHFPIYFKF